MIFKKSLAAMVMVLAMALLLNGCGDKIVAEVNGVKISQKDFEKKMDNYIKNVEAQGYGDFLAGAEGETYLEQIRKDMLEDMITRELLFQEAKKLKILPDESAVTAKVEEAKSQLSPEEYEEILKELAWTEKDLAKHFLEQLVEMAVYEAVTKEVSVDEKKVREFYEQNKEQMVEVRANHILVETAEEAKDIIARLEQGADFSELAKELSIDTASAINGGDLGYFSAGVMVPEFEIAAFNLPVGQFSKEPVQTQHGFHIIKVFDKKEPSLAEKQAEIKEMVAIDEKRTIFNDYLAGLMDDATIVKKI